MLAQRGTNVSEEAVRCWANKFGLAIAANIRRARGRADSFWHLDEIVLRINRKRMFMWRAVDTEGEVLDVLVHKRRNKAAAMKVRGCRDKHQPGRLRDNNRVANSHLPVRRRERKTKRFKSQGKAQRFVSVHSAIYNSSDQQRHLVSRKTLRTFQSTDMAEWSAATSAAA